MHPQVIQDHPGTCPICHMKLTPLKNGGGEDSGSDEHAAGPAVIIDPTIVQNMGVRTAEVKRAPLRLNIRAVGTLAAPEPGQHEINLKVNGWIQKLYADTEGMHVLKGDPLFDLYSPDLQVAGEELISAVKVQHGLHSALTDTQARDAQLMVDSARQKLKLWGVADEDIDAIASATTAPATVPFRSPVSGALIEKPVIAGSAVQAGMKLMRIEDHAKLWLNTQVYENQLASVKVGQMVRATVDGVADETFEGPVTFIDPHVDPMTRTTIVRVQIDNPGQRLHPGMFAMANIMAQPVDDAVLVPREAVIDTGTRQIAFVTAGDGRFTPRNVRMGLTGSDGQVQILDGLASGEQVVTSGQFLMDVESRTTEAIQKLRSGPASEPAMPAGMPTETPLAPPAVMPIGAATQPALRPAMKRLNIAHCPMKKADWLQVGQAIANPYYGTEMSTCGDITRAVPAPMEGTPLSEFTSDYLAVVESLGVDQLNSAAIGHLAADADRLSSAPTLQASIRVLTEAKTIDGVRLALKQVSADLISALETAAK
ncbi:MAG: cation efflux system periplasmic linker protein [Phycisphaerales bacterium]|nr:cation efflux system periplasmic linker protein [Phycisphaerales bacterium]